MIKINFKENKKDLNNRSGLYFAGMNQEILNLAVLHNISSVKEDGDVKVFYSFPQDVEIIRTLKKLQYNILSYFYEECKINSLKKDSDLVFNICDGFKDPGDEYKLIENLEKEKIPYTGCSSSTTKLCQNKFDLKKVFKSLKINCPNGQLFENPGEMLNSNLKFPLILKPLGEHGSRGIEEDSVIFNEDQLRKKLSQLFFQFNKPILIEDYIEGREFNVPIIGNKNPDALGILEIDYSRHFEDKPKILTYKAKWSKNSNDFRNTYSIIAKLNKKDETKIYSTAISAYKAASCSGYASVDLRMDDDGNVFVIEINPNCYIAPESDMLKAALSRDWSYEQLLDKIIGYAVERFSLQNKISISEEIK